MNQFCALFLIFASISIGGFSSVALAELDAAVMATLRTHRVLLKAQLDKAPSQVVEAQMRLDKVKAGDFSDEDVVMRAKGKCERSCLPAAGKCSKKTFERLHVIASEKKGERSACERLADADLDKSLSGYECGITLLSCSDAAKIVVMRRVTAVLAEARDNAPRLQKLIAEVDELIAGKAPVSLCTESGERLIHFNRSCWIVQESIFGEGHTSDKSEHSDAPEGSAQGSEKSGASGSATLEAPRK